MPPARTNEQLLATRRLSAVSAQARDPELFGKRQTEIEVINGAIVDAGKRTGVPTPVNETMVWMIQAAQAHYLRAKA